MENSWKKTLYLVWFVQILSLMSFSFGLPFLPYYIQDLGMVDPERVRLFTGILSAAPAIGMGIMAPVWGMVADRFGKKTMLLGGAKNFLVAMEDQETGRDAGLGIVLPSIKVTTYMR